MFPAHLFYKSLTNKILLKFFLLNTYPTLMTKIGLFSREFNFMVLWFSKISQEFWFTVYKYNKLFYLSFSYFFFSIENTKSNAKKMSQTCSKSVSIKNLYLSPSGKLSLQKVIYLRQTIFFLLKNSYHFFLC